MMELVPLRVYDPPGTRTTLSCSYRSNERLDIEFEALTLRESERILRKRDVTSPAETTAMATAADRYYSWGANRKWSLVVEADHRMVVCRLKNRLGLMVGQLFSVIESGSAPCSLTSSIFNEQLA
jgi:hypothetical protein